MISGFNNSAKNAIELAQEEVKNFRQNVLGTEHILIGLMLEQEGIAGKVLRNKINVDDVREIIKNTTGMGETMPEYITISPRSKYILELARQYSSQMGLPYVGTEHILLGLIDEGDGIGAQILKSVISLRELKLLKQSGREAAAQVILRVFWEAPVRRRTTIPKQSINTEQI